MNKITQIENALKAIDSAKFQSLINHLLYLQGNKFIGAPGAVVGKEKTSKGTPDSFFINGDKYMFVESTTKEKLGNSKSFFKKLSKDIDHCFNNEETSIRKDKIGNIVLACTEEVTTKEYELLKNKVQSYNLEAKFEILNIQNLPLVIYEFPKLAEEYLDVKIVIGDIFTLEEFLIKTTKGLQPSLINEFVGREDELKKCIESLQRCDKLLLSGGAGVGKSKLAVKLLEDLSKQNYVPIVIQSSAVPLWDEFNHYFQTGKNYIVLFDDANKSIHNLNYLLSIIDKQKSFSIKVVITSRDYVKKQVSNSLSEHLYEEVIISEFNDQEIEKIIVAALPNLKYHNDIKKKIIDLAKGNARVALMATYSVTPESETNYLTSPVLLYEKYFKKISQEISIFDKPIILKSLAIVSFFGILDRNNEELKGNLYSNFGIDWNNLWSAIMELHSHEILDVYSDEVVKVSDQVLASYAFYKCFINDKSSLINYSEWIASFIKNYSYRISATLVDANNTFDYYHVKELVVPHLNDTLKELTSNEQLYSFYNLFWFYKGLDCLLYLKKWIKSLPKEQFPETLKFNYEHNNHVTASKYFELLIGFWSHSNELLKPSIELTIDLVALQPSRLSEILKFLNENFKYKLEDRDYGYLRQNTLLDVLLDETFVQGKMALTNGIFLNIAKALLGWHYTEHSASKGRTITFYNFDLYTSKSLIKLRERILNKVHLLFEPKNEQIQEILDKIIHPGGNIDKKIYLEELPIYQKIISQKLDKTQYSHCKFVTTLSEKISQTQAIYPENWDNFIKSDIMKMSIFLKSEREYRKGQSHKEFEKEKQEEFDKFIKSNDWATIEKLLFNIDVFYKQQTKGSVWHLEGSIIDIYISIAKKDKSEFEKAIGLFFSGGVFFPLRTTIINYVIYNGVMTGEEFTNIMNKYEFKDKSYWESVLLAMLPEEQINESFLKLLIDNCQNPENNIYLYRMLDYLKYYKAFDEYKNGNSELENHNIITYLTSSILSKPQIIIYDFGIDFFVECASYFSEHITLLKKAYLAQKDTDQHFDHQGKELEAILKVDSNFLIEILEQKATHDDYLTFELENFKFDYIWTLPNYEEIINKALDIIIAHKPLFSNGDYPASQIFQFQINSEELQKKALLFLDKYMITNITDRNRVSIILNIVMYNYHIYFIDFMKKFLTLNKNFEIFKSIHLSKSEVFINSRVPYIQSDIDFCIELIKMVNSLPDILSYSKHIDYLEKRILWLKKDIKNEQRRDFEEEHY